MWRHIRLLYEGTNVKFRFYSTDSLFFAGWDEDGQLIWTALRSHQNAGRGAWSSHQGKNKAVHPYTIDSLISNGTFDYKNGTIFPVPTTNAHGASAAVVPLILNRVTRWMWVVSSTLRPPYPRKVPLVWLNRRLGWLQSRYGSME